MNPFQELLPSGTDFLRLIAINAINFFRPELCAGTQVPGPTARMAEPLRVGEIRFTAPQGFLRRLSLVNIHARPIPLDNVAVCIAKRHFPMEHPAVFSIGSADPRFVFEDFSAKEARSPPGQDPLNVFRVNDSGPIPTG